MLRRTQAFAPSFLDKLAPMAFRQQDYPLADETTWVAEIKFDGYRGLAEIGPQGIALRTKNGADCTAWFPEVVNGLTHTRSLRGTVLDGEFAVLDDIGRSDFDALHARARRRCWYEGADPVTFCAFDILVHEGSSVVDLPLLERKRLLEAVLAPVTSQPGASTLFVKHMCSRDVANPVSWLYQQAVSLRLEGVVAKRANSLYRPGTRTSQWLKFKRPGAVPAERFAR